jgi:hypothetical protein
LRFAPWIKNRSGRNKRWKGGAAVQTVIIGSIVKEHAGLRDLSNPAETGQGYARSRKIVLFSPFLSKRQPEATTMSDKEERQPGVTKSTATVFVKVKLFPDTFQESSWQSASSSGRMFLA